MKARKAKRISFSLWCVNCIYLMDKMWTRVYVFVCVCAWVCVKIFQFPLIYDIRFGLKNECTRKWAIIIIQNSSKVVDRKKSIGKTSACPLWIVANVCSAAGAAYTLLNGLVRFIFRVFKRCRKSCYKQDYF